MELVRSCSLSSSAIASFSQSWEGSVMTGLSKSELDAEASEALEAARAMPNGPEKSEALKKAGLLRKAADAAGISFARRGRPRKDE